MLLANKTTDVDSYQDKILPPPTSDMDNDVDTLLTLTNNHLNGHQIHQITTNETQHPNLEDDMQDYACLHSTTIDTIVKTTIRDIKFKHNLINKVGI